MSGLYRAYFCHIFLITIWLVENASTLHGDKMRNKTNNLEIESRIIGGQPIDIKHYPYIVSIQHIPMSHICGASYIQSTFVLTAAHCVVNAYYNGYPWQIRHPTRMFVLAGSNTVHNLNSGTGQIRYIERVLPHPLFRFYHMFHDIALLRLNKPFEKTAYVQLAPLPIAFDNELFQDAVVCTVAGWGRIYPYSSKNAGKTLRHVQIPLIETSKCRMRPLSIYRSLCAGRSEGGIDSCQGDSGGPLICNGLILGIVSWGFGCAEPRSPGVYCRVDGYLDWINSTMARNCAGFVLLSFYYKIIFLLLQIIMY